MDGLPSDIPAPNVRPSDVCLATALEGLQGLDELPVVHHVAWFNAVHEALMTTLSSIDEV